MEKNNTVSVKLSLSGSKKRVRLDVPLKISQLRQQVRKSFPTIGDFKLLYVDEEGDNITVTSDEDLEEAQAVFKNVGRVISFIVDSSSTPDHHVQKSDTTATTSKVHVRTKINSTESQTRKSSSSGATAFPAEGDVVELHSLSTADFNGRHGQCGCFDRKTGRHRVVLFASKTAPAQTISVRTRNLKVVRPKSSGPCEQSLPISTPFGPGSFGSDVAMLQNALIKLGYMHPSAIRFRQGFYGPRTTASVSKIAKAIGCPGGGVYTDRVRAHLLEKLASADRCPARCTSQVSAPTSLLQMVSMRVSTPNTTTTTKVSESSTPSKATKVTVPVRVVTTTKAPAPVPVTPSPTKVTASVSMLPPTEAVPVPPPTEVTVSPPNEVTAPVPVPPSPTE